MQTYPLEPAVAIDKASVTLGTKFRALDGVTAAVPSKKIVGFIGPSGAGKTTLIRSIVGRQRLSSGAISVFGHPAGSPALRTVVSYMTQEVSVYDDLTVAENLAYFATMISVPRGERTSEVNRLLETVGLTARAHNLVQNLSGGEKQRVSLAIALIGQPRLLVLDEPTVGLDPVLREQLWQLFRRLADEGSTLIISSHVMDEAERCDELLLIRDGRLLTSGTPAELRRRTGTDSIEQSFLKLVGAHS